MSGNIFPLISGNTLQLITRDSNSRGCIRVFYNRFNEKSKYRLFFGIRCENSISSRWSYIIEGCSAYVWDNQYLSNVPFDKVKHWIITKSSTHLNIICNKVTVLNYNFATDSNLDGTTGKDIWSKKSDSCVLKWQDFQSVLIWH